MKDRLTTSELEKMRIVLSVAVIGLEMRPGLNDMALTYLKAALTEVRYMADADMEIINAAISKSAEYLKTHIKENIKQFPPGGIFSNTPPGEHEFVIQTKKPAP